ncbi:glycosyltransferase [Leifsonia sp. F6_8S_P_1B]|uniref:Glycosyltransferase n=1 Tax=Leifsonia williamsii TaxID=3035919 RepID=A0ABT8KB83_9MICO|nr:glycosyltransferase [Leifsonia williamsii]MDN4614442.1 glycosyltransferase [Leifsonia williamsii]
MYPRVTAIVVAHSGGPRLQRTLDAIAAQTRRPDAVIAVDCATSDDAARLLADANPTQLLSVAEKLPFGAAVATAVRVLPPANAGASSTDRLPGSDRLLWLLAHDTAPEPEALEALLAALEVSPSVAVVGPKLVDADEPAFIREFGETMTPFGASVPLVENELDQAQHDGLSDVLAVSSAGMLVRQSLWEELDGFDPALPTVDDGLDFCTRARLAGYRVTLVAQARVALGGDGVAGPNLSRKWSVRRRLAKERRAAQLHRRLAYAPGWAVPFHWLSLVPLGILRALLRLLRKEPGSMGGELLAAFRVAFSGMAVGNARRRLARARTVGWAAVAPLRIPFSEVRRSRALKREAAMVSQQGERQDLDFFGAGGGWTVLAALVIGVLLFFPLLSSPALTGGGMLPLDASVGRLWADLGYGWRDASLGFVGAADPFSAVLAVLGTITFWQPSLSLVLLTVLALPLSALGAWLAAARLTVRPMLRAFGALAYALAPTLLVALQGGRPSAVLAHVLLPWLFFAGLTARRSWTASAVTALLAAATAACAPILIPALVVAWIATIAFAGRRAARIAFIPVPAIVLFAPLVWQQAQRGAWLSVLVDPGLPVASRETSGWQLAMGFPDGGLGGWQPLADALGIPALAPTIAVPLLLAPLGVLALLALFLRGTVRAVVALVVALTGFVTAVAAAQLQLAATGGTVVAIWPGSGLSLYWLGLVGAAVLALSALGRAAIYPLWVALVALAVVAVPAAIGQHSDVVPAAVAGSDGRTMPAVVGAKAATQPRTGTLRLTPQAGGGLAAEIVRGSGETLDAQTTLSSTQRTLTGEQRDLATLAGNLASRSGYDASAELKDLGIDFVLLAPPATGPASVAGIAPEEAKPASTLAADEVGSRAAIALDANALLAPVGTTASGQLWAFDRGTAAVPEAARIPGDAGGIWRLLVLLVQGVVIGATLLMAIPTTRSADRVSELTGRRPDRRPSRRAAKRAAAGAGAGATEAAAADETSEGAGGESDATGSDGREVPVEEAEPEELGAVEPDDALDEPPAGDTPIADESLQEYEAEPLDEASVEAADEEGLPAEPVPAPAADSEPAPAHAPVFEARPAWEVAPAAAQEPAPAPEPGAPADPAPDYDPDETIDRATFERLRPAWVTTPSTPTTLEDGLEETIIRPRRASGPMNDGGDRG